MYIHVCLLYRHYTLLAAIKSQFLENLNFPVVIILYFDVNVNGLKFW